MDERQPRMESVEHREGLHVGFIVVVVVVVECAIHVIIVRAFARRRPRRSE